MERARIQQDMVEQLIGALGDKLLSVVLWAEHHLLVVTTDLEPATLRALSSPVHWWLKKQHTWPRLFTPELIRDSRDVFPIELLDLSQRRRVLHGNDPFAQIVVDRRALRVQCERELREKLMRLREAYVEHHEGRALRDMLHSSLTTFARIFRACLVLLEVRVPVSDHDVIASLCDHLDLDREPFFAVERGDGDFESYYRVLSATEARVDRLIIQPKENV